MYSPVSRLRADLLVTSAEGTPQLIIEVKKYHQGIPLGLVRAVRERVAVSSPGSYFLFISTQRFWLWPPRAPAPSFEGEADALLAQYIDLTQAPLASLSGHEFELLVYSWLSSVIFKPAATLLTMPGQQWLVTTGLQPLIYKGFIRLDAALD